MSSISLSPLRVKLTAPLLLFSPSSVGHSKLVLPLSLLLETAHFWPFLPQMLVFIYPPGRLFKEKSNPTEAVDQSLTRTVSASGRNAWVWVHGWLWESRTLEVRV